MRSSFVISVLLSLLLVSAAFSEDTTGKFGLCLEGGYYLPELGELNDDFIYGGAFTYHFKHWLFAELRASMFCDRIPEFTKVEYRKSYYARIINDQSIPAGQSSEERQADYENIRAKVIPVDFNVGFSFLSDQKVNPYISLGGTFYSARIDELPKMNDTAWGFNGGIGAEFFLMKLFEDRADLALTMDCRYRWGKANFGLGYTSMEIEYYPVDEYEKLKKNTYLTSELEDMPDDLDLGGISATAGLKVYF
ncbi:MAG: outer membrane beta-barrel protein [Candidatus Coatesbacteria bacterium]|nr:outer membrane beta-barrel protein [Candidatus Coatesbacteria bacterium]